MPNNLANDANEGAVSLTQQNIDMTLGELCDKKKTTKIISNDLLNSEYLCLCLFLSASNELVFINFYAQWCRFSNVLAPIFEEAATKIRSAFPEPGRVVMAKVDCDRECEYTQV